MTRQSRINKVERILYRLRTFNRKERDHLMKFALCENPEKPTLSKAMWNAISSHGKINAPDPSRMFVGMDYHLNWLFAALVTAHVEDLEGAPSWSNEWVPDSASLVKNTKDRDPIQNNQEDIDLLVAWSDKQKTTLHLALVEAKLDSGWTSEQFKSKKERLALIKHDSEQRGLDFINWHFLLMSPGNPPTRNEFALSAFEKAQEWMLEKSESTQATQLAHRTLPVQRTLRQVSRVSSTEKRWLTTVSLKPNA